MEEKEVIVSVNSMHLIALGLIQREAYISVKFWKGNVYKNL